MSHHSYFSMWVFDPRDSDMRRELMSNAFAVLLGIPAAPPDAVPPDVAALRRRMSGITRSDWIKAVSGTLFDAAGSFDALRFISEQTYTHRELVVTDTTTGSDADPYGNDLQFTVLAEGDLDTLIVDVERFIRWCANNVPQVVRLIECDGEAGVLDAIYRTPASEKPTELDDEGQGIHCLLSTLKSVRELLVHARRHGLRAVYQNVQYTSREGYRESLGPGDPPAGHDGRLHANDRYMRPVPSRQPLPPFPATGLPIDVPALVAASTDEERAGLKAERPYWADGDEIDYLFEQEARLLETGRVVWAALLQVNKGLLEPTYVLGASGEVIFDRAGRVSPEGLLDAASFLFRLKGNTYADERLQFFAQHLANERERIFGKEWIAEGYPLEVSSIYFDQVHLPDGMVTLPYFPVIVSDECPGAVKLLPWRLWPQAFTDEWMAASEKRFGVRHSGEGLRAEAVARAGRAQAEFDADPAPFNLDSTSLYEEGLLYFHGRGVPQDQARARALWEKAARFGHPESMNNLGVIYGEGVGVAQDRDAARAWYQRAADKGHPLGELNLGKIHLMDGDAGAARAWLQRAAAQGNQEAAGLLVEYGLNDAGGTLGRLFRKWRH